MRPHDKKKNIQRANILAEQRYLESKGYMQELTPYDRDVQVLGDYELELHMPVDEINEPYDLEYVNIITHDKDSHGYTPNLYLMIEKTSSEDNKQKWFDHFINLLKNKLPRDKNKFYESELDPQLSSEINDLIDSYFGSVVIEPDEFNMQENEMPLMNEDERIRDAGTGEPLSVGDVVEIEGAHGTWQIVGSYSEGRPTIAAFDMSKNEVISLDHRIFLTTLRSPKMTRVRGYAETKGGFMSE